MTEPLFSEVIRVQEGVICVPEVHAARMDRTARRFWGGRAGDRLDGLVVPDSLRTGRVKCRIVYGPERFEVSWAPYVPRTVRSLSLVAADDTLDYAYKYLDRSRLERLRAGVAGDEVLIVRGGLVTDTTYTNVVLEDVSGALVTPAEPLLRGTMRKRLLGAGRIEVRAVRADRLGDYRRIHLINAMLDLGQTVVPVGDVIPR